MNYKSNKLLLLRASAIVLLLTGFVSSVLAAGVTILPVTLSVVNNTFFPVKVEVLGIEGNAGVKLSNAGGPYTIAQQQGLHCLENYLVLTGNPLAGQGVLHMRFSAPDYVSDPKENMYLPIDLSINLDFDKIRNSTDADAGIQHTVQVQNNSKDWLGSDIILKADQQCPVGGKFYEPTKRIQLSFEG